MNKNMDVFKNHIVSSAVILIMAAVAFCQTSQPADGPQKAGPIESQKIQQPAADGQNKTTQTATSQPAETQPAEPAQPDTAKLMAKALHDAKTDYNKTRQKLIKEKACAEQRMNANQKELDKTADAISRETKKAHPNTRALDQKYSNCTGKQLSLAQAFHNAEKKLEQFKQLVPGKTYFRQLGKGNLSEGDCGQLISIKYQIAKKISDNAVMVKIATEQKQVLINYGASKIVSYRNIFQTVKMEIPAKDLMVGQSITDDGIFYVKAVEDSTPVIARLADAPAAD